MKSTKLPFYLFIVAALFLSSCIGAKRTKKAKTVIRTARSYMGTPYVWGGTSKKGMDCSGLLWQSYKSVGVDLPRTSIEQSKAGRWVSKKKVKPGDLVFFATTKKRRKITHAGIVTEVRDKENVKFIHASSSKGVMETNLYSKYFRKRFRKARRVL